MKILVIEDDHEAAVYLLKGLSDSGHKVDLAHDGETGYRMAMHGEYDALVVDRMLPGRDGLSVIAELRNNQIKTPILVLSAMADVDARVEGLQQGGDDYLAKPYALSELLARLDALVRRTRGDQIDVVLNLCDLEMDCLKRTVTRNHGKTLIHLQPREFQLLEYMLRHTGQVITRMMLLEEVWGFEFDPHTNIVDVHISRLRNKIDKDFNHPLLHTVRGTGYSMHEDTF